MVLTINQAFKDRSVSHHNCCKTVGKHNPDELKDLAIVALQSGNTLLLECFIDLPTLDEILQDRTASQIADVLKTAPALTPEIKGNSDLNNSMIPATSESDKVKAELDAE